MGTGAQACLFFAAIVAMLVAPGGLASPAGLETHVLATPPSLDPGSVGTSGGYTPSFVVADVAGTLVLTNTDLRSHDLVSHELGPTDNPWCQDFVGHHFCPLFASPMAPPLGGQVVVDGTDQLVPGTTYSFFCSIHDWMEGTLVAI